MKVDRQQFLEQGYLILRDVIPPAKLEELRTSYEVLVERQKAVWSRDRAPGDPPGGVWETAPQPRLGLHNSPELIDDKTAIAVEFCLHENTLGVSEQLIGRPGTSVNEMMMMCNPVRDRGPAEWHRDIHPIDTAPLAGYVGDFLDNGPRQVQWNIPMYDDSVLWVMPGSHCRLNTDEENAQLLANPRGPLRGALTAELGAGDGVVYASPMILHWASNYSSKLRRTIHVTYGLHSIYHDLSYTEHLSEPAKATFQRWAERSASMHDVTESVLRAAIERDAQGFRDNLEQLRPGVSERGKMVFTVFLAKAACHIYYHKHPELDDIPEDLRRRGSGPHATTLNWGPNFANRFSLDEADALWQRFKPLDDRLQADEVHFSPGFQSGPMHYYFNEMPAGYGTEDFIASWS